MISQIPTIDILVPHETRVAHQAKTCEYVILHNVMPYDLDDHECMHIRSWQDLDPFGSFCDGKPNDCVSYDLGIAKIISHEYFQMTEDFDSITIMIGENIINYLGTAAPTAHLLGWETWADFVNYYYEKVDSCHLGIFYGRLIKIEYS